MTVGMTVWLWFFFLTYTYHLKPIMMRVIVINTGINIDYAAASSVDDDAGVSFVIFAKSVPSILMWDIPLCIESSLAINLVPLS